MTLDKVEAAAQTVHLTNLGAFHGDGDDDFGTLVLLGPDAGFWPMFIESPEYLDGQPDPMDRWSRRVITEMAKTLGANPRFPFGGPPHYSFLGYAEKSKSAFPSKVGMLVHHQHGLMISFRGALCFDQHLPLQVPEIAHPCDDCRDKPCLGACPVNAIIDQNYDVSACKSHLRTPKGKECLQRGCKIRKLCPLSSGASREAAQSGYHMQRFLKG